jgi:hypothetical protein
MFPEVGCCLDGVPFERAIHEGGLAAGALDEVASEARHALASAARKAEPSRTCALVS